ncbi:branched-chain amino acid ABC transporter permease [Thermodesulfobacteriota bacterium]
MQLKENYFEDIRYFDEPYKRWWTLAFVAFMFVFPYLVDEYWLYMFSLVYVYIIAAVGLNLLMGYCGQFSLGHASFVAVGAYAATILSTRYGWPFILCLPAAGLIATAIGLVIGISALRLRGIYLAIITMGFVFILEEVILFWDSLTNGPMGMLVETAEIFGFEFDNDIKMYYLILVITLIMLVMAKNIVRSRTGRAFTAVRDSEIAAESMGIKLAKYKVIAFGLGAFYAGITGVLYAQLLTFIGPEGFTLMESISYVVMILLGGLGSILGSVMGAAFITFLTEFIRLAKDFLPPVLMESKGLQIFVYGGIIVGFIMFEPHGLYGRWLRIREYFDEFPLGKRPKSKRLMVGRARDLSI